MRWSGAPLNWLCSQLVALTHSTSKWTRFWFLHYCLLACCLSHVCRATSTSCFLPPHTTTLRCAAEKLIRCEEIAGFVICRQWSATRWRWCRHVNLIHVKAFQIGLNISADCATRFINECNFYYRKGKFVKYKSLPSCLNFLGRWIHLRVYSWLMKQWSFDLNCYSLNWGVLKLTCLFRNLMKGQIFHFFGESLSILKEVGGEGRGKFAEFKRYLLNSTVICWT